MERGSGGNGDHVPKGPGLGKTGLWNSGDLDWESCSLRCCKVLPGKAVEGSQVGGSQPSSSPGFAALFCDPEGDSGPVSPVCKVGATLGQPQWRRPGGVSVPAAILLLTSNKPGTKGRAPGKETLSA